ncbi:MAG: HAD hydrolase family protein [Rikenellaceae bacterium]
MGNFKEDIAKIKAFVFDVDGVLTDGGITVTADGDFIRRFCARDGFAISYALKQGYTVAIITGGRGHCLKLRLEVLGIKNEHIYMNCYEKLDAMKDLLGKLSLGRDEVIYMGDDIPDVEPMMYLDMSACPSDAAVEVISAARYVSQCKGGEGCGRDIIEQVLRARGDWPTFGQKDLGVASR